jgi:hypothetical protein
MAVRIGLVPASRPALIQATERFVLSFQNKDKDQMPVCRRPAIIRALWLPKEIRSAPAARPEARNRNW